MKYHKDIVIYGVHLLRHLKGHQAPIDELTRAKLSLAAVRSAARVLTRRTASYGGDFGDDESGDDFFTSAFGGNDEEGSDDILSTLLGLGKGKGGNDEDESGDDFFTSAFGGNDEEGSDDILSTLLGLGEGESDGNMIESFEQCGIDVGDMVAKGLGAFMMYGSEFDPSSPESAGPLLLALKDDNEKDCSVTDEAKMLLAVTNYYQCSGFENFFLDIEPGDFLENVVDDCKPVLDVMATFDVDAISLDSYIFDDCAKTLLGDNPVGNFIRYEYQHVDKTLGCLSNMGEELPHCVVSFPEPDGEAMAMPLSLDKKLACVVGSTYEIFIEEACVDTYESLDKCLPGASDVEESEARCPDLFLGNLGIISSDVLGFPFGMDTSVVTGNAIPDFCYKVYEGKGMDTEELQSRLEDYNKNRDYGWTIESLAKDGDENDHQDEVKAVSEPPKSGGEDEFSQAAIIPVQEPQALDSSKAQDAPVDESFSTSTESEPDGSSKKTPTSFIVAGLAIAGAVLLAVIVKYRTPRANHKQTSQSASSNKSSRKEYAHVAVGMDQDGIV